MAKTHSYRGRRIISLRLDDWHINGLKLLSKQEGHTVTDIVADLISRHLEENGINAANYVDQIVGRMDIDDMGV